MSVERQLLMAASGVSTQYTIAKSLRFRSSASAYLNRTPSSAGNRQTWTWSAWIKRGALGVTYAPIFAAGSSGSAYSAIWFNNDTFVVFSYNGSTAYQLTTTQVFRDPSAWYHIQIAFDSTQATSTNRIKIYVNGTQVTSFSASIYPAQNYSDYFDSTAPHYFGQFTPALGAVYFDGYLAEINFIDGQALTPSSFGETSATTGVWIPKQYSGSYGTNGFYLKFTDTTSTTTLGNDSSGNGNNWTPNNLSLTTGSTYDSMLDSPTNYDNGGTGVGNYAVLNAVASDGTISNANLAVAWSAGGNSAKPATVGMSSGKWYCEIYMNSVGSAALPGIIPASMIPTAGYPGSASGGYGYYYDGQKYTGGTGSAYGASYTTGDVIGVSFDADAGSLTFYKNGVSQGVAFSSIAAGTWFFAAGHSGNCTMSFNFGQRPFAYTPPTGFKALNTQNLPAPSIVNGASYMAATTYTGTGASLSVSGAAFQPDLVWIKSRSAATDNKLTDSVRGTTNALVSNSTAAATTDSGGVTAFNSNGFTLGTTAAYNTNATTYVAWQWKAGGTAVTNTAGSITSSVSANTTSGFSVVTYTSQASGPGTFGHGLGVAPNMVIVKIRNAASTSWGVYHSSLPNASYYLILNATDAQASNSVVWNSTAPTSSVVTLGSGYAGAYSMVAYCFAAIPGYSAFGSYTGNGSADGPFVYCGFRPRFVLIKNSSAVGSWFIWDTARNQYNVMNTTLLPNASNAEIVDPTIQIDSLSNGFKLRGDYGPINGSGNTIIYAAFAENPFQNARAR